MSVEVEDSMGCVSPAIELSCELDCDMDVRLSVCVSLSTDTEFGDAASELIEEIEKVDEFTVELGVSKEEAFAFCSGHNFIWDEGRGMGETRPFYKIQAVFGRARVVFVCSAN